MKTKTIVFDLDDTLVNEYDYLKSAFSEIARTADAGDASLLNQMLTWHHEKQNVFANVEGRYPHLSLDAMKQMYRKHVPSFANAASVQRLLAELKGDGHRLGLVTDGFSVTQRNKIKALGIGHLLNLIIISEEFGSEKPNEANFRVFHNFGTDSYWYIGDNVKKDFVTPNALGWTTVCLLDDGNNIHPQDFSKESIYLPAFKIDSLEGLRQLIKNH